MKNEHDWLSSITELRQAGRLREALALGDAVLEKEPDNTNAMVYRAMLLYELDLSSEALLAYQELIRTYAKQGNYLQAFTAAKDLAALDPALSKEMTAELAEEYQDFQVEQALLVEEVPTQDFPPTFTVESTMSSLPSPPSSSSEELTEEEMIDRLISLQEEVDTEDFEHDTVPPSEAPELSMTPIPLPPLFRQLDAESTAAIWASMEVLHFDAKELVIQEGDSDQSFFIIADGTLRVTRMVEGQEEELGYLGVGQFFGEIALLTALNRTATVRTVTSCKLLRLERSAMDAIILRHESVLQGLKHFVYQRLIHNVLFTSLLFFPLPDLKRWELAQQFAVVEYPENYEVVSEGEQPDGLYLVAGGKAGLYCMVDGWVKQVGELKPGQFFGELSILTKTSSGYTVKTEQPTTFLKLSTDDFHHVLDKFPRVLDLLEAVALKKSQELQLVSRTGYSAEKAK